MNLTNKSCPACDSDKLWHKSTELEDGQVTITFSCLDCNANFKEIYSVVFKATEWT